MFASIHVEQDKSGVHQAPRHLAVFVTGMHASTPFRERGAFLGRGDMTASHFSMFSERPLEVEKSTAIGFA